MTNKLIDFSNLYYFLWVLSSHEVHQFFLVKQCSVFSWWPGSSGYQQSTGQPGIVFIMKPGTLGTLAGCDIMFAATGAKTLIGIYQGSIH
jgi:hypothetical protein